MTLPAGGADVMDRLEAAFGQKPDLGAESGEALHISDFSPDVRAKENFFCTDLGWLPFLKILYTPSDKQYDSDTRITAEYEFKKFLLGKAYEVVVKAKHEKNECCAEYEKPGSIEIICSTLTSYLGLSRHDGSNACKAVA